MRDHKFYTNSKSAWVAMLQAISCAQRSVYFESYIFEDDMDLEYNFLDILVDRAKNRVKIKIVLDSFGSYSLSQATIYRLKSVGIEVCFFGKWFRRIHRKVLIVDEEIAFLGGVNIGDKFKTWIDLHLRLTGKRIVASLVRSFSRSYFYSGGVDPEILGKRKNIKIKKAKLWLLENFPWTGKLMLRPYYKEKITLAKERVVLVTPYFVPHYWLIKILKMAVSRGVIVEVIIPSNTDPKILNFANHVFVSSLYKTGIKFYKTKDMIHAKALLVDDHVGLVGSNNIDGLSFDINAEAGVSFESKNMVRDLKNIIDIWKADATLFIHDTSNETWYYKIAEAIIRFIQPIL